MPIYRAPGTIVEARYLAHLGTPELRLCRMTLPEGEVVYDFHLVFFGKMGGPVAWYSEPYAPWGENPNNVMNELNLLLSALTEREVIDLDTLETRLGWERRPAKEKPYAKAPAQHPRNEHQSW